VGHPVGLAQPDHAAAQGQPSTEPVRASCGSAPGLSCGSPWGRPAGCHTLPAQAQPQQFLCPAIPEACPPGEGMVWLGRGAFADVAAVAGTWSGDESGARPVRSGVTQAELAGGIMIILGIVLLVVGYLLAIPILWTLGIILVVIGVILVLLGTAGHAIGGRRHYY
jgi:hypothetical protein